MLDSLLESLALLDATFWLTAAATARDTPPAFLPARPITRAALAALTERCAAA